MVTIIAGAGLWGMMGERESDTQPSQVTALPNVPASSADSDWPENLSEGSGANWDTGEEEVSALRRDLDQWRDGAAELWPNPPP